MRRPRPIARLIDGPSGASAEQVLSRVTLLTVPAMVVANAIGALVVFVLAAFVIPSPRPSTIGPGLLNLGALVVYVTVGLLVGSRWGIVSARRSTAWLVEGRAPDEREQRDALRSPLRIAQIHAVLWTLAAPLFALLNLHYSGALAVTVGITTLLGGFVTAAVAFLLSVRIGRPMTARVLDAGVPRRPVLPGMTTRAVLAWALGSGVPLVGLMLVAFARLIGRDITGYDFAITALGLSAVGLVVGAGVVFSAARATAAPVLLVRDALERVEGGDLDARVDVIDDSELGLMQAGFNRMVGGLREREELRDLFGRHVGEEVAREALSGHVELGGEVRDVAVLFVDVVGSTEIAATRPADEVVDLLNAFFDVVVQVVTAHGGWINKFEGDAALAVYGVPIARDNACDGALATGRELARRLRDEVDGLDAAIGVSAGEAVAGNVGATERYEYTVIGDPVNEAARLCELAKARASRVLASAAIVEGAGEEESRRWTLGETVELRGRTRATRLAEPAS